jgi:ribosomal protein S18 acetylase RimI-like enzyme
MTGLILGVAVPIRLRPAEARDDAICGLLTAAALAGNGVLDRLPHARAVLADRSPFPQRSNDRLLAEEEGQVAGFIDFAPRGRICYLFVHPRNQNRGVGSALLHAAEAAIVGPISLEVLSVNDQALLWYLRRGYSIVGREQQEDWYGGPVVWIHLEKTARGAGCPPAWGGRG